MANTNTRRRATQAPEPQGLNVPSQVQIVARTLQGIRSQRFQAEVVQTANDHSDEDMHPDRGIPYSDVIKELDEAEKRLVRKYAKLMPQVEKILNA